MIAISIESPSASPNPDLLLVRLVAPRDSLWRIPGGRERDLRTVGAHRIEIGRPIRAQHDAVEPFAPSGQRRAQRMRGADRRHHPDHNTIKPAFDPPPTGGG